MRYTDTDTDTEADADALTRLAQDLMRSWSPSHEVWKYLPSEALPIAVDELGDVDLDALEAARDLELPAVIRVRGES